ncbi:hypothetical protein DFP72DRAFT_855437 [Ephemerocybe angulata]|uniref:Uncharacterized protein n=1 Tax=Ephemerocybe angulata TaxID=980116 RepID=A0A8H6HG25_9AGAR|nr:hypothetical protein DFP72DRAFT_855437 [Tulosesus angulatus]
MCSREMTNTLQSASIIPRTAEPAGSCPLRGMGLGCLHPQTCHSPGQHEVDPVYHSPQTGPDVSRTAMREARILVVRVPLGRSPNQTDKPPKEQSTHLPINQAVHEPPGSSDRLIHPDRTSLQSEPTKVLVEGDLAPKMREEYKYGKPNETHAQKTYSAQSTICGTQQEMSSRLRIQADYIDWRAHGRKGERMDEETRGEGKKEQTKKQLRNDRNIVYRRISKHELETPKNRTKIERRRRRTPSDKAELVEARPRTAEPDHEKTYLILHHASNQDSNPSAAGSPGG